MRSAGQPGLEQDTLCRTTLSPSACKVPTHWDALGHIFYEGPKAYNGYDAKLINSRGLSVLGIEHSKNKMVGRGVLLDIARFRGVKWMQDGESISNDELESALSNRMYYRPW